MTMQARLLLVVVSPLLAASPQLFAEPLKERPPLGKHSDGVWCVVFAPDGKMVVSACRGVEQRTLKRWAEVCFWDVATGKALLTHKCHRDGISSMAFSPDGNLLATASSDETVQLWDVTAEKGGVLLKERATLKGVQRWTGCLAFSPDGKRLAAGSTEVKVWDVTAGRELVSFNLVGSMESAAFSPDLGTLASPNYQDLDLWDVRSGKLRLTLPDHRGSVCRIDFTADGRTVAVGSYRYEEGRKYFTEIKLWDPVKGQERALIKRPLAFLRNLTVRPDGRALILQEEQEPGGTAELTLLTVPAGRSVATISFKRKKDNPWCLAFSPNGKILAAGCVDGTIRLWDVLLQEEPKPSGK